MNDAQELILALIDQAQTGEHTKFEQLRFFNEYIAARITHGATKKVVAVLKGSANKLFRHYCKDVKHQWADMNMLIAYKQLQLAVDYYKEEQKILKAILKDYEQYFWEGDCLKNLILGKERDIWNIH